MTTGLASIFSVLLLFRVKFRKQLKIVLHYDEHPAKKILYYQRELASTPNSEYTENIGCFFFPSEFIFLNLVFNLNYF